MSNRYGLASPRAIERMRRAVDELARATGRPMQDLYHELGAYEDTSWGPHMRTLTGPLVSALTTAAHRELARVRTGQINDEAAGRQP